jgi:hypothetical protein
VDGILVPLITALVGAAIGFFITRLNDWLVERRELQRAGRHLRTEAANVARHYAIMRERLLTHETEPPWRNSVHLDTCRYYGNGLGTFDTGALRLFDDAVAEEAMYLMLMTRNINSYVDQAKLYLSSGEKEQFHAVCRELIDRCQMTVDRAEKIENVLRGFGFTPPSGRVA